MLSENLANFARLRGLDDAVRHASGQDSSASLKLPFSPFLFVAEVCSWKIKFKVQSKPGSNTIYYSLLYYFVIEKKVSSDILIDISIKDFKSVFNSRNVAEIKV